MFSNGNSFGGDPATEPWILTGGQEAADRR